MSDKNSRRPYLSDNTADKLLANVFDACGQEPNTIPLKKLASYSEYRREKFSFQKVLLILTLVVFALLPLCFIAPEFTVVRTTPDSANLHTYEIRVTSNLPVRVVAASLDGEGIYVNEAGERTYTVSPTDNGTMNIKVSLANFQYDVKSVAVTGVDIHTPTLSKEERVGDELYLYVEDEVLGVDWEAIYAENNAGEKISPLSYNSEAGCVVFTFPEESLNIYIPDMKNNILQLVLTM